MYAKGQVNACHAQYYFAVLDLRGIAISKTVALTLHCTNYFDTKFTI